MVFVMILIRINSSGTSASCAAGVKCFFIHYYHRNEGAGKLSSKLFNESFVSIIFENGQCVSLRAQVVSVVIDGVEQPVTGGSLRHSRGEKIEDSTLNTVNESVSLDLAFSYCLTWLCCLVEIIGNSFFYDLVIGFSAD